MCLAIPPIRGRVSRKTAWSFLPSCRLPFEPLLYLLEDGRQRGPLAVELSTCFERGLSKGEKGANRTEHGGLALDSRQARKGQDDECDQRDGGRLGAQPQADADPKDHDPRGISEWHRRPLARWRGSVDLVPCG